MSELERVADELARTAGEGTDARALARVGRTVVTSARRAGAGAVASGQWLADVVMELAGRVPPRDLPTLTAHHDGLTVISVAAICADLNRTTPKASN